MRSSITPTSSRTSTPHYGVDQRAFATRWAATSNHAFVALIQRELADVTWYELSLDPQFSEAVHEITGARVRFVPSSAAHRTLARVLPPGCLVALAASGSGPIELVV